MTDAFITVPAAMTVEEVLDLMVKKKADFVAVADGQGALEGYFSHRVLLRNLLLVPVSMTDGLQLDIKINAAPGVAKRLKKIGTVPVGDLMERKPRIVGPDTPTWEGIGQILTHGEPVLVVDPATRKLLGIITESSAVAELQRLKNSEGAP